MQQKLILRLGTSTVDGLESSTRYLRSYNIGGHTEGDVPSSCRAEVMTNPPRIYDHDGAEGHVFIYILTGENYLIRRFWYEAHIT